MSNPANRLPPEYDDMQPSDYDPQFTADISTRMRVPDHIGADIGPSAAGNKGEELRHRDLRRSAAMMVPEKIVMIGDDLQVAARDGPSDLHLDFTSSGLSLPVALTTPPRTLTLDDRPFPGDDQGAHLLDDTSFLTAEDKDRSLVQPQNGYIQRTPQKHSDSDSLRLAALQATPGDGLLIDDSDLDEMAAMRRQIAKLSRHVLRLEEDSSKRSQRETVLYPIVFAYFLFRLGRWFFNTQ